MTVELQLAARDNGGRLRRQQPEPATAAIEADESEEVEISSTYREVSREFASMANGRLMVSVTDRSTGWVMSQGILG